MLCTTLEEIVVLQKNQAGMIQSFWSNLRKAEKDNLMRIYLTTRMEFLESYWSQVLRTHYTVCEFENIIDSEYTKQDIFLRGWELIHYYKNKD